MTKPYLRLLTSRRTVSAPCGCRIARCGRVGQQSVFFPCDFHHEDDVPGMVVGPGGSTSASCGCSLRTNAHQVVEMRPCDRHRLALMPELSERAKAERRPLPPEMLIDALQDRVHKE